MLKGWKIIAIFERIFKKLRVLKTHDQQHNQLDHRKMEERNDIIIYNTADGKVAIALYAKDGNVWMNQKQLAELFDTSKQNIGQHIANILKEGELAEHLVVKNYFTTASDGKLKRRRHEAIPQQIPHCLRSGAMVGLRLERGLFHHYLHAEPGAFVRGNRGWKHACIPSRCNCGCFMA
jgi:hypothetical protein